MQEVINNVRVQSCQSYFKLRYKFDYHLIALKGRNSIALGNAQGREDL